MRRHRRDEHGRVRGLQGLRQDALADVLDQGAPRAHFPVLALEVVRRRTGPDRQHHVDRLDEHRGAVLVEVAEGLGVGQEPAGTDAEVEPPVEQVIEHRNLGGHRGGVGVRHVHRAGAEADRPGRVREGRDEQRAGGDVLGGIRRVFAAIPFGETELVGEQEGFPVFAQALAPVLSQGVDRHGEITEMHQALRRADGGRPS